MTGVRWQVDAIAGPEVNHSALQLQPSGSLQQQDPFTLFLVVPEAGRRGMPKRDDAFHADTGLRKQRLEMFFGQVTRQLGEEIDSDH